MGKFTFARVRVSILSSLLPHLMPTPPVSILVRRSPVFMTIKVLTSIFILSLTYSIFIYGSNYDELANKTIPLFQVVEIGLFLFIAMILFEFTYAVSLLLRWSHEAYEICYDEIIHRAGVFSLREQRYGLKNIEHIFLRQSFFGRMLNYGSLQLQGRFLKEPVVIPGIADAKYYSNTIKYKTILSETTH